MEGAGHAVLGIAGLVAALLLGASPARAILPFAVAALALGGVQAFVGYRWYRAEAEKAVDPHPAALIEVREDTVRRTMVKLTLPLGLLAIMLLVRPVLGAIIGGVWAGIGVVDLLTSRWAEEREAAGTPVYRELGNSPFSGGRRTLYRRMSADTEAM